MRGIGDGELATGLTSATPLARPRVGCSSYRRAMDEALGGTAKGSEMGEFDCVQTSRAVLIRVDGINTFGVSAGHFAWFGTPVYQVFG